jgi:hypothetical protein
VVMGIGRIIRAFATLGQNVRIWRDAQDIAVWPMPF